MALTLVLMLAFVSLGIDVGMIAIAKTQTQNAADLAALTAARSLSGDPGTVYNNATATSNAQTVVGLNSVLGRPIQSSQMSLTYGSYDYNQSTQTFNANFPATTGQPYTAVNSTVTSSNLPAGFSTVLGRAVLPTVTATAQAVHRPRDLALVMDLSGSMRFGTLLGFDFYTSSRTTNNPDTTVPTFGHYSSSNANLVGPAGNRTSGSDNYTISASNSTAPNASYAQKYVDGFYQNAAYASTLVRAFDSYTSSDGGNTWTANSAGTPQLPPSSYTGTPGGDVPLYTQGTTNYATDVNDVVGGTSRNAWWELDGYSGCANGTFNNADLGVSNYASAPFNGYTQGPGYYGKTFFVWPPDPRRPLNSSNSGDAKAINQFLQDFGYATADFNNAAFTTTLSGNINSSTTTIAVSSSTPFPTSSLPFRVVVNNSEIMYVTAVAGSGNTTWTVQRGQDSTSATSASKGNTVALVTAGPLYGLYGGSTIYGQAWPWPNDGGSSLGTYLTSYVYIPSSSAGTARLLNTSDAVYQKIMRLYNWNYVVDSLGTTPCDWRVRFFGTNDNTKLFNSSGSLNTPGSSTYTINYNEILRWISTTSFPFPSQMRAGRVKYYGSIPTAITGSWPNYGSTDQRFWVEFIDYTLGFRQTAAGVYQDVSAMAGYGPDFTWGSVSLNGPPSGSTQYMNYTDIPARPMLRFWFGPLMMTEFLHNYNLYDNVNNYYMMQPGDTYEAPVYNGKQAYLAAINTIENNHPNDWFTLVYYSAPRDSASSSNRFNCVACPLGTNYAYAKASLFFPFSTINADGSCNNTEVTPYDTDPVTGNIPSANFADTPRADGDTCFAMSLMLCYNQFAVTTPSDNTLRSFVSASPITFPTGMAGGMGRKGAQKVIIFETDGMANCDATASLVTGSGYNYYQIRYDMNRPGSSEFPAINPTNINNSAVLSNVYSLVTQLQTDYSTSRNPFRLYALGFGPVFSGPDASVAQSTLQTMQYNAGTQSSPSTPLAPNQIITGTGSTMSANMISAFTSILENGVQVALTQ